MSSGLRLAEAWREPLLLAELTVALRQAAEERGFTVAISNDFRVFADVCGRYRNQKVSPFFDPAVNAELDERAFWLAAADRSGEIVSLNAYRLDLAEPSFADWAPGWIMGLYLRRGELLVPKAVSPPTNSVTERVHGRVVYHGEVWIAPSARKNGLLDILPRLGMFITMIKWQPDAMWGIIGKSMAVRGQVVRLGYSHMERGFLQWEFLPEGGEDVEWLVIAQHDELELLAQETDLRIRTGQLCDA